MVIPLHAQKYSVFPKELLITSLNKVQTPINLSVSKPSHLRCLPNEEYLHIGERFSHHPLNGGQCTGLHPSA